MKKIATRQGFGEEIVALGKEDNGIYVVDVDIGKSCKTTDFAKQLPNQHVNVGIAEQNAAGVAGAVGASAIAAQQQQQPAAQQQQQPAECDDLPF